MEKIAMQHQRLMDYFLMMKLLIRSEKKLRQYSLESYHIEIAKRIVASPCTFPYRSIDPKIVRKNKVLE